MEGKKDKKDKNLCLTCKHYWEDFPMLMEDGVPHCEIFDEKSGLRSMDVYMADYPCLKCPFNCYEKVVNEN